MTATTAPFRKRPAPMRAALASLLALAAMAMLPVDRAHAGPALVFEVETSRILRSENEDTPWYPASLTKLMTAYMVFDALKRDAISGEAQIVVSPRANAQPKMRIGLGAGKRVTVKDALAGLIIHSANDLAVALAEAVAGSEDEFVVEMNEMAVKLGMVRTRFANANGLPKEGQVTTARDMAILARALLRDFPEWRYLYAETEAQVGSKTVRSHNDVLKNVDGADGMKTGFTCGAGYNVVASAKRDGRKIVAVVLGEASNRARTSKAEVLLEQAFAAPPATASAPLIDTPPLHGEMLVDMALLTTPERAANSIKVRNCWAEPPPQQVAATGSEGAPSDPAAGEKLAQVVPPAPPVKPAKPEPEKKAGDGKAKDSKSRNKDEKPRDKSTKSKDKAAGSKDEPKGAKTRKPRETAAGPAGPDDAKTADAKTADAKTADEVKAAARGVAN